MLLANILLIAAATANTIAELGARLGEHPLRAPIALAPPGRRFDRAGAERKNVVASATIEKVET